MANKRPVASLNTMEYDLLIDVLKEARSKTSQTKVSRAMGYHDNFLAKIEIKERRIDVAEFYFFAEALGLDPVELFKAYSERIKENRKKPKA